MEFGGSIDPLRMIRLFIKFLVLAAVVVSGTWGVTRILIETELKRLSPKTEFIRELSETERYKMFLYEETIRAGLNYQDYRLLREIIRCESGWRQYWSDGSVILSSGNIGLAQINVFAHEAVYKAMGLDINNPYDNLRFAVFLYKRDGVRPWGKWSGRCWGHVKN